MIDNPCGKRPYQTADLARQAAAVFARKKRSHVHYYRCPRCGMWHLSKADQSEVKRMRDGGR